MYLSEIDLERFMTHVIPEPNSGCHLWNGVIDDGGYGVFSFDGLTLGAHVVSHWHFKGPVKPKNEVHHRCRVSLCVNHEHLEALSKREHGAKVKHTNQVSKLRIWLIRNEITEAEFGRRVGVAQSAISRIARGKFEASHDVMRRIYRETDGKVTPNDIVLLSPRR